MKRGIKYFGIIWLVGVILFNAITFLVPNTVFGVTRFDKPVFWIAYALIMLSFVIQAGVAFKFIQEDGAEKMFLNIPLLKTASTAIVVSVLIGLVFLVFPILPAWIGAIICLLVAGFVAIACVKATIAADYVAEVGERVKTKTAFMRMAVVEAENILARAQTDEAKAECKKVYEAVRYSDPMSSDALASIENDITIKFSKLSDAVVSDDSEAVVALADEIIILLGDRNKKCKLLK